MGINPFVCGILAMFMIFRYGDFHSSGCADHCICYFHDEQYSQATCNIAETNNLQKALDQAPSNLLHLVLRTQWLAVSGFGFGRFQNLTRLELLWNGRVIQQANPVDLKDSNIFKGLGKLEYLLVGFPVRYISESVVKTISHLKVLHFSNTGYLTVQSITRLLPIFHSLHEIVLHRLSAGIDSRAGYSFDLEILYHAFAGMDIKKFSMSGNTRVRLYPGLLQYLPNLESLDISKVRFIYSSVYEAQCAILGLILHPTIKKVDMSDINGLDNSIDLYNDGFTSDVSSNCFQPRSNSDSLNLCICRAYKNYCGQFSPNVSCDSISKMDFNLLARDFIKIRKSYILHIPPKLEYLDISGTAFGFYSEVQPWLNKTAYITHNSLRYLIAERSLASQLAVGYPVVYGLENLVEFNMIASTWPFYFVNPAILHKIPNLEILRVSYTNFGIYLQNDTSAIMFRYSSKLRELHASHANITVIPQGALTPLRNLELLNLSLNKLSTLPIMFIEFQKLQFLDFSNNNIDVLTDDVLLNLRGLENKKATIDLSSNKMECDCNHITQVEEFQSLSIIHELGSFRCNTPGSGLQTLTQIDTTSAKLFCIRLYLALGGSLLGISIIIIVIACIYRKREVISYWFVKFHNRKFTDIQDLAMDNLANEDNSNKKDVFIIYNEKDRSWVHDTLLKKLESDMKLRVVIHFRDFTPGNAIEDEVIESIKNTRKTIAVLSPNFLQSGWCKFELEAARFELQREGRDLIIPIILHDLPRNRISPTLRQIINEKVWLKWTEGGEKEKYFWKRLQLALRCKTSRGPVDTTEFQDLGFPRLNPEDRPNCNMSEILSGEDNT